MTSARAIRGCGRPGAAFGTASSFRVDDGESERDGVADWISHMMRLESTVFEVPVADHWLTRKEALALPTAMFMALALSHHVTDGCSVVIG